MGGLCCVSDFWLPELVENILLLLSSIKLVVIYLDTLLKQCVRQGESLRLTLPVPFLDKHTLTVPGSAVS